MKCQLGFYLDARPGVEEVCEPCENVCHPAFLNCTQEICQEYWYETYKFLADFSTEPPSSNRSIKNGLAIGLGVTIGILVIITVIVIAVYYLRKRKKKPSENRTSIEIKNQAYMVLDAPEQKRASFNKGNGPLPHDRERLDSGESEVAEGERYDLDDIMDVIGS